MYPNQYGGYYDPNQPQGQYQQPPQQPYAQPPHPQMAPGGFYPPSNPDVSFNYGWYDPSTQNQFYSNYPPQQGQMQPAPVAAANLYTPPANVQPLPAITGKRKALLIGINYFGTKSELQGCINDTKNVYKLLSSSGYSPEMIHLLNDDSQDPNWMPTRANILRELVWLVWDAAPGDSLFFMFSGHGGQKEDESGDEDDGFDETILPSDYRKAGVILDDDLHDQLVKKIPAGAKLTALMDCCHSGTGMDLPFVHTISAAEGKITTVDEYSSSGKRSKRHKLADQQRVHAQMSWGDVTLFSGCRDDQTSSDARSLGKMAQGAMCFSWLKTLQTAKGVLSYYQVLSSMRNILKKEGFEQIPQLSTGRPIDLNATFTF